MMKVFIVTIITIATIIGFFLHGEKDETII